MRELGTDIKQDKTDMLALMCAEADGGSIANTGVILVLKSIPNPRPLAPSPKS
jgi:hypothetical protein